MILFALLACFGTGEEELTPQINGTITTAEASGEVAVYKAFAFHAENKAVFYMTSTPDADCPSVAEYLSEKQVDPAGIWEGGTCNLSASISEYDPAGTEVEQVPGEFNGTAIWSVRCALGEGSFEWTKRDEGSEDTDFFWTGDDAYEWTGDGSDYEVVFSGDGTEEDPYFVDVVQMSEFSGNYPTILDEIPASGSITGSIEAQTCNQLSGSWIWEAL